VDVAQHEIDASVFSSTDFESSGTVGSFKDRVAGAPEDAPDKPAYTHLVIDDKDARCTWIVVHLRRRPATAGRDACVARQSQLSVSPARFGTVEELPHCPKKLFVLDRLTQ
jgi:hypothetical protein